MYYTVIIQALSAFYLQYNTQKYEKIIILQFVYLMVTCYNREKQEKIMIVVIS